jgi:hypothetical protein
LALVFVNGSAGVITGPYKAYGRKEMSALEIIFVGNIGTGLAVGVGVALVGPVLTPLVGGVVRPVAKAALKAGMLAYDAGRQGFGRLNEMSGDIMAEARSELSQTKEEPARARSGPSAPAGAKTT